MRYSFHNLLCGSNLHLEKKHIWTETQFYLLIELDQQSYSHLDFFFKQGVEAPSLFPSIAPSNMFKYKRKINHRAQ